MLIPLPPPNTTLFQKLIISKRFLLKIYFTLNHIGLCLQIILKLFLVIFSLIFTGFLRILLMLEINTVR